jgi:hypothetical protein
MKNTIWLLVAALVVSMMPSTAGAQDACPEFKNMVSVISEDGKSGGSIAIDDQGRIVVAGSSRVGDPISGDRYGVVARLLP